MFRRTLSALLASAVLALAGCAAKTAEPAAGPSPNRAAASSVAAFPVTLGGVTLPARPVRIVSLSPTATETLFAIGAGSQVVAVDDQSDYPPNAPRTKLSGFEPNVEAIAGYQPDLVVISIDPGGLVKSLTSLEIPVLVQPAAANLRDTYEQIDELGRATGHGAQATTLVTQMRAKIAAILASVPAASHPVTVYHELDDTYYSATSRTFVGRVYRAFGLENIADGAPRDAGDYPQLSSEYIVSANPDLIVLADASCCGQSAATLRARPGWASVAALHDDGVVEANGDVVSRWGPRVVDFFRLVARAVIAVERSLAA